MISILVHGYVQMENQKPWMSMSKEAFIETVVGRKYIKLVLYFSTGKIKTLLLSDNIKGVTLRACEGNQYFLHLAFHNNDFLLIEKLSFLDAQKLKSFFDRVQQNRLQPITIASMQKGIFTDTDTQNRESIVASTSAQSICAATTATKEISKPSQKQVSKQRNIGYFEVANKAKNLDPKMPVFPATSTSKELVQKQPENRKRTLSYDSDHNENKSFLVDNNFIEQMKSKEESVKCESSSDNQLKMEKKKKSAIEFSFVTNSVENICLKGTAFEPVPEKKFLPYLFGSSCNEDGVDWDEFEVFFSMYPEKMLRGLPNLGNTCYINAVLQCLCSVTPFVNDLLNQGYPWSEIPHDSFSMYLTQILFLKDIFNMKAKEKVLVDIKIAISEVAKVFSTDMQNDAHEFLTHCLDEMKETIQTLNAIQEAKNKCGEGTLPRPAFADNAATQSPFCPVVTNFEVELLRSIFCKSCGNAVLKTDPNNYLSINLPQGIKTRPLSIQYALDHFFSAEELEYKCEKCKHNRSVAVNKLNKLSRVLVIHLKRYSFNEFQSLKKDKQEVIVSKYLKLSSHCNRNTKLPPPLSKNGHRRDNQLLKGFQKMTFDLFNSPNSSEFTSKFMDETIGSENESESQKLVQGASSEELQSDLGGDSDRTDSGDEMFFEEELLEEEILEDEFSAGSKYQNDVSASLVQKDEPKPSSSPVAFLGDGFIEKLSQSPKLDQYEKTNTSMESDLHSMGECWRDLFEDNPVIPDTFQNKGKQTQMCDKVRMKKEAIQQAFTQRRSKLNAQGHMEAYLNSPNSKKSEKVTKKESEAKDPMINADKDAAYTYRLIGVISHIGNTPHSGHYISDAYNFNRQKWFTYNDLHVMSIPEVSMQEARICTGYIFFYMYNETFEELLERTEDLQRFSHKAESSRKE
ncbi:ubiquitin carboxyl-terminal hydrolase 26 [Dipodomys spectabilis]|uniref:ubiquitin carboxyl-terminal hydrolase 26 n=1 Tax=Dipodomys spectabilis TaxID=105255 RepID=UPI001C535A4C|nr:ubiquitin carboxyl-terminal hydrolase 26 [Dipodomys spectabilis]